MSISYKANVGVEEGFQFGRAFALSWRTPGYYVTQFGLRSSHNRLRGDQPCHVVQDAQGAGREQVIPDGGAGLDAAPLPRPRRPAWEDRKPGSVTPLLPSRSRRNISSFCRYTISGVIPGSLHRPRLLLRGAQQGAEASFCPSAKNVCKLNAFLVDREWNERSRPKVFLPSVPSPFHFL